MRSTGTIAACGGPPGPATTGAFITTMPAKRPCASSAAAPAESQRRRGFERPRAGFGAELGSHRRDRRSAALRLRIGDADQRDAGAARRRAADHADRRQVARAIDAQQRKLAADIGGDALGIAETGQRDDVAAVDQLRSVSTWPVAETNTPVPYSTLRRGASAAPATAKPVVNGTNALDIGATSGSMVPSIAWS